jgi:hypothetical protein
MLKSFTLNPYSRTEWSGYDSTLAGKLSNYGSQFKQSGVENFTTGDNSVSEAPITSSAGTAAPYGLKGDKGDTGPAGPIGAASTVPGPAGPAGSPGPVGPRGSVGPAGPIGGVGPKGEQGIQGIKGDKGDKGEKGDRGLQGVPGTAGSSVGVVGPKGDKGNKGDKGDKGDEGAQGPIGPRGSAGANGAPGANGVPGPAGPKGDTGPSGKDGGLSGKMLIQDTRNENLSPEQYLAKGMGVYHEFKDGNSLNLPGGWVKLETTVPWWDWTGGNITQESKGPWAMYRRWSYYNTYYNADVDKWYSDYRWSDWQKY